jgi:tRNA threonylcarbamoyladenosine biosynthesis protein TsaB
VIILALDASTYRGSVALFDDERMLAARQVAMRGAEREHLMPAVAAVLDESGRAVAEIGRVVCGRGPGSFTSLRIAGSIAKGIATGVGCPLFDVSSLALLVAGAPVDVGRYLAALDALRGEFYVGLYETAPDHQLRELERAKLVPADRVDSIAVDLDAKVVSPTRQPGWIEAQPDAAAMVRCATLIAGSAPVDIESWEPLYGRLAEAQVRWESAHARPLPAG